MLIQWNKTLSYHINNKILAVMAILAINAQTCTQRHLCSTFGITTHNISDGISEWNTPHIIIKATVWNIWQRTINLYWLSKKCKIMPQCHLWSNELYQLPSVGVPAYNCVLKISHADGIAPMSNSTECKNIFSHYHDV